MKTRLFPALCVLLIYILLVTKPGLAATAETTRALWVTRWDYKTQDDVKKIIDNAASAHFNTILFQVRGDGTVLYRSRIEPWAKEFNFMDPGWDPLKFAVDYAHTRNIRLHAWINVYPAWGGIEPPQIDNQLFLSRPNWLVKDLFGNVSQLNSHYVWLSPTHPEVQDYLLNLLEEIYTNYDIDGINLDYFRYPGNAYSFDEMSLDIFHTKFNASPQQKPGEWIEWRKEAISSFLEKLYGKLKSFNPQIELSACVKDDFEEGKRIYLQDSHEWLARGIIDAIYPMIYTRDDTLFKNLLLNHLLNNHSRHVFPGIFVYDFDRISAQLNVTNELGCQGFALFDYMKIFPQHDHNNAFALKLAAKLQEKISAAKSEWKFAVGDHEGPVINRVHTVPLSLKPGNEFKIAARITDPSGVHDDDTGSDGQGVYLVYGDQWPPVEKREIHMSRIKKAEDWYITDEPVVIATATLDFRCRIFAWDNYSESAEISKRNLGYSDIWSLSVLDPNQTYLSAGFWGPVLWYPQCLEVDPNGRVWIACKNLKGEAQIIILEPDGEEAFFSPVKYGLTGFKRLKSIANTKSLSFSPPNVMCAVDASDIPIIFRFNINTGQALPGIEPDFKAGGIDCDGAGNIFILEEGSTVWHVLSSTGRELQSSPYGILHTGQDIAVLDDASKVFIVDRTTNGVQCWQGAVEGTRSRFWRADDLASVDVGTAHITKDLSDYIYIPHTQRGIISIVNRAGNPVAYLSDGSPPLNAPRDIGVSPDGMLLYVLESAGEGMTRLALWSKKR